VFIVLVIVHCSCYYSLFLLLFIVLVTLFIVLVTVHLLPRFFRAFSLVVRKMPGYNSQDGARPSLSNFHFSVLFSYLCIMRTVCV
jgi:hypothetical protein